MSQTELTTILAAARRAVRDGALSLVFGARGQGTHYDLRRADLSESAGGVFRDIAAAFLQRVADARLIEFDVGYKPERDEILVLDVDRFEEQDLARQLQRPETLAPYDPRDAQLGRPVLYAVITQRGRTAAVFLRKSTQVQVGTSKRFLGLIRRGRLDSLDEPVFAFDASMDVFITGSTVFIANPASFQQLFKDMEALRAEVGADLRAVAARVPIANLAEFLDACASDPRMMTKLGRVAARPYLADLTLDDVRAVIDRYGLPHDLVNDHGELVHSQDRSRRWLILKLLDDDYLESRMTEQQYEVNSKLEHRR